jgi:hypothetical protein
MNQVMLCEQLSTSESGDVLIASESFSMYVRASTLCHFIWVVALALCLPMKDDACLLATCLPMKQ